jgi:hypothetical protein
MLETVIVNELVVADEELPSVTLTEIICDPTALGVPEITPVFELSERPAGSDPEVIANKLEPLPPEDEMFSV